MRRERETDEADRRAEEKAKAAEADGEAKRTGEAAAGGAADGAAGDALRVTAAELLSTLTADNNASDGAAGEGSVRCLTPSAMPAGEWTVGLREWTLIAPDCA